jgi:hypothetical protein
MLISFLLICYTLFTAYISGVVFLHIFSKLIGIPNSKIDFVFAAISGLCWISILVSIQHIFSSVGIISHLLVWIINVIVWSANSKDFSATFIQQLHSFKTKHKSILVLYFLFLIGSLINIVARPASGDAADYHFQAIRWMEEYAVVPGIGNVRRQLGNNSNWFLLNAFFGFSFTGLRSVYVLNATLLLIAVVYFSESLNKFLAGNTEKYFAIKSVVLIYLMLTIFRKYVGAVTNDYVITVMILYVFTMLLEIDKEDIFSRIMLVFFIAVMVTFKLSALPMVLLAFLISLSLIKQINFRYILAFCLLLIALILPWIYTNVMNCGYLVFPISNPDLFTVDWKMNKSVLEWEVMANLAWARVPFTDVDISSRYIFAQWFPLWIKSLDGFSILLMVGSIVSTSFLATLFTIKKLREKTLSVMKKENLFIIITGATALYLWFTHGPTPRFVFGYLTFILAAQFWVYTQLFSTLQEFILKQGKQLFILITLIFFVSCISFLPKNFTINTFAGSLIFPSNYVEVKTRQFKLKSGFVNVPQTDCQCWDSPLPCTSELDTTLMWRAAKMEDGFKIIKKN